MNDEQLIKVLSENNKKMIESLSTSSSQPSWFEHPDLMWVVILALITIIVWLLKGWHKSLYDTIGAIQSGLNELSKVVHTLRGEHNQLHCRRKTDPESGLTCRIHERMSEKGEPQ